MEVPSTPPSTSAPEIQLPETQHSTPFLPPELQLLVLKHADWEEHEVLSKVCRQFRHWIFAVPQIGSKRYFTIARATGQCMLGLHVAMDHFTGFRRVGERSFVPCSMEIIAPGEGPEDPPLALTSQEKDFSWCGNDKLFCPPKGGGVDYVTQRVEILQTSVMGPSNYSLLSSIIPCHPGLTVKQYLQMVLTYVNKPTLWVRNYNHPDVLSGGNFIKVSVDFFFKNDKIQLGFTVKLVQLNFLE